MSFDYINEAFKKLDALSEDMFDTSLTGLNNLSDFMEQDNVSNIVKVIDPDAETDDAVSDSYIGKVIINCNVCHSHIFETKEDVAIDEDGIVNASMQCPYCGEMSGFTVVGEIAPFETSNDSDEQPVDANPGAVNNDAAEVYNDLDAEPVKESFRRVRQGRLNESGRRFYVTTYTEDSVSGPEEGGYTSWGWTPISSKYCSSIEDARVALSKEADGGDILSKTEDRVHYIIDGDEYISVIEHGGNRGKTEAPPRSWAAAELDYPVSRKYFDRSGHPLDHNPRKVAADRRDKERRIETLKQQLASCSSKDESVALLSNADNASLIKYVVPEIDAACENISGKLTEDHNSESFGEDNIDVLKNFLRGKGFPCNSDASIEYLWGVVDLFEAGGEAFTLDNLESWYEETCKNFPEDIESLKCDFDSTNSLTEDVNNVNVETDDTVVNVHTEENGKVVVTTEPKSGELPVPVDNEMTISPISNETMQDIEANNDAEPTDEDPETLDLDFDEIDEEGLDDLGESYLKRIYENVKSFKTTSVSTTDSKMIVEGTILFTSGVKKNTGFVFEAHSATHSGNVNFVGTNKHFSEARAFTLSGRVANKKLIPESLGYNYRCGTRKVCGTVGRKRGA